MIPALRGVGVNLPEPLAKRLPRAAAADRCTVAGLANSPGARHTTVRSGVRSLAFAASDGGWKLTRGP